MYTAPFAFLQPHNQFFFKFKAEFLEKKFVCCLIIPFTINTQIFSKNSAGNLKKNLIVRLKKSKWCGSHDFLSQHHLYNTSIIWINKCFSNKRIIKSKLFDGYFSWMRYSLWSRNKKPRINFLLLYLMLLIKSIRTWLLLIPWSIKLFMNSYPMYISL